MLSLNRHCVLAYFIIEGAMSKLKHISFKLWGRDAPGRAGLEDSCVTGCGVSSQFGGDSYKLRAGGQCY